MEQNNKPIARVDHVAADKAAAIMWLNDVFFRVSPEEWLGAVACNIGFMDAIREVIQENESVWAMNPELPPTFTGMHCSSMPTTAGWQPPPAIICERGAGESPPFCCHEILGQFWATAATRGQQETIGFVKKTTRKQDETVCFNRRK